MSGLVWSSVLLWIVVVVQAVMIVAILRYLGTSVLGASGPGKGPPVRTRPPSVLMENLRGEPVVLEDPGVSVRNVFFLSTTCKVCRHMLQALRELRRGPPAETDLFVIQGNGEDVAAMADAQGLAPGTVVPDPRARIFRSWNVVRRPYVVVLDENGLVKERGQPEARDRLREFVEPFPPPAARAAEGSPS